MLTSVLDYICPICLPFGENVNQTIENQTLHTVGFLEPNVIETKRNERGKYEIEIEINKRTYQLQKAAKLENCEPPFSQTRKWHCFENMQGVKQCKPLVSLSVAMF